MDTEVQSKMVETDNKSTALTEIKVSLNNDDGTLSPMTSLAINLEETGITSPTMQGKTKFLS